MSAPIRYAHSSPWGTTAAESPPGMRAGRLPSGAALFAAVLTEKTVLAPPALRLGDGRQAIWITQRVKTYLFVHSRV